MGYDKEYITARVNVDPQTGCWNWKLAKGKKGYPLVKRRSGFRLAHRLAFSLWKGPPGQLCVCHECDNPPCVNPDHLFLGTYIDNAADQIKKGRKPSKLKEADIHTIRASNKTNVSLAAEFGVCKDHISRIRCGTKWGRIPFAL